jgi:hypothetical protein
MQKQIILDELNELLNIPQAERIIHHKIKELKVYLRDEISLYQELKEDFRKATYGNMQVCHQVEVEPENSPPRKTFRFELDREESGGWNIVEIEPSLPAGLGMADIIPPLIVNYMTSFETHPTRIETVHRFTHPQLHGRVYRLRFAKYSDYHLLGTITEIENQAQGEGAVPGSETDDETGNILNINDYYKNNTLELNYKQLMYYMEKYHSFREHIFSEFFMKWKPLLDRDLLEPQHSS